MSKGTQNASRKWEQPWDTYLEAGGNGGIFIVGCLWIPNQVIPAGEHLEAEREVSTLPLTRTALGIAGHPVGCIPLLLAQGNLGLSWAGAQVVDMQWGERAKMIQIELYPGCLPPRFRVHSKHTWYHLDNEPLNHVFYPDIWLPVARLLCQCCLRTLCGNSILKPEYPLLIHVSSWTKKILIFWYKTQQSLR